MQVTSRLTRRLHAAILKMAETEKRSMNAQIDHLLTLGVGDILHTVDVAEQESKVTRGKHKSGPGRPRKPQTEPSEQGAK